MCLALENSTQSKVKWAELCCDSLRSALGVMSDAGQPSAGVGQSCHMKMSLEIKKKKKKEPGKRRIYQELRWTKKLSYLQEHYSNEGQAACWGSQPAVSQRMRV